METASSPLFPSLSLILLPHILPVPKIIKQGWQLTQTPEKEIPAMLSVYTKPMQRLAARFQQAAGKPILLVPWKKHPEGWRPVLQNEREFWKGGKLPSHSKPPINLRDEDQGPIRLVQRSSEHRSCWTMCRQIQPKGCGHQQHCESRCSECPEMALGSLGTQCDPKSREQGLPEHLPKLSGEGDDSKQTLVGADIRESCFGASWWCPKLMCTTCNTR